jgi:multiple sugar transport system permease protein
MRTPLMITTVILTIFDFNVVVAMIVLTGGGPGHATETLSLRMYEEAFGLFRMGTAASVSTIIFAINLSLSLLYFAVLRQRQALL